MKSFKNVCLKLANKEFSVPLLIAIGLLINVTYFYMLGNYIDSLYKEKVAQAEKLVRIQKEISRTADQIKFLAQVQTTHTLLELHLKAPLNLAVSTSASRLSTTSLYSTLEPNCVYTAQAYPELSAETVWMRLTHKTCNDEKTNISGYVRQSSGKLLNPIITSHEGGIFGSYTVNLEVPQSTKITAWIQKNN